MYMLGHMFRNWFNCIAMRKEELWQNDRERAADTYHFHEIAEAD